MSTVPSAPVSPAPQRLPEKSKKTRRPAKRYGIHPGRPTPKTEPLVLVAPPGLAADDVPARWRDGWRAAAYHFINDRRDVAAAMSPEAMKINVEMFWRELGFHRRQPPTEWLAPEDFRFHDEAEAPEPVDPEPKPEPVGLVDEPAEAPESPAEPEPVAEVIEQAPALEPADPEPKSEPAGAPVALVAEPGPSPLYVLPVSPRGSAVEPDISRPLVDLRSLELVIGGPRIVYSLAADGLAVGDDVDGEWRLYRDAEGRWLRAEVAHFDDDYGYRRRFSEPLAFDDAVADGLAEARYVDADEVARLLLADRPYLDREAVDAALAALTWSPEPTDDRANADQDAEPDATAKAAAEPADDNPGPAPSSGVPGFDPRPDAGPPTTEPVDAVSLVAAEPASVDAPGPKIKTKEPAATPKRGRGRPPLSAAEQKFRGRIVDAWHSREHRTYADLADAFGVDRDYVARAVDSLRNRMSRAKNRVQGRD